ncbi:hypothetical protein LDC_0360, partial [sediment metagenome]
MRAAQREVQHAGAHRAVAGAVDKDEATQVAVHGIRLERHGAVEQQRAQRDVVERQCARGQRRQRVDVEPVLDLADAGVHGARAQRHQVAAARQQCVFVHPHHVGLELIGHLDRRSGRTQHVATRDVDLIVQRQRDRFAGHHQRPVALEGDDARHRGL